jgi:hypothetical protein
MLNHIPLCMVHTVFNCGLNCSNDPPCGVVLFDYKRLALLIFGTWSYAELCDQELDGWGLEVP